MRYILFALALVVAVADQGRANLVVNGSFETPNVFPSTFVAVPAGNPMVTGWTVGLTSVDIVNSVAFGNPSWSYDGDQAIDMTGTPGPGSIEQALATTAGGSYTLSFALSSNVGPHVNGLEVYWDGGLLATLTSPAFGTWTVFSYGVTATTGSTLLKFVSTIGGFQGPLVDAVSVEPTAAAVPEPGTLGLAGLAGLIVLGRSVRRRRAA